MAEVNEYRIEKLEEALAELRSGRETLAFGQVKEMYGYLGIPFAAASGLIGIALWFSITTIAENRADAEAKRVATEIAKTTAKDVSQAAVVRALADDEEFVARVVTAATTHHENSVVTFDVEDGCPPGWIFFAPAAGRMIVGAGEHDNMDAEGDELTSYPSYSDQPTRALGGTETHTLALNEMPNHSHTINDPGHRHGSRWLGDYEGDARGWLAAERRGTLGSLETPSSVTNITLSEAGGDQPHNNMPPYIALYFCKKEG